MNKCKSSSSSCISSWDSPSFFCCFYSIVCHSLNRHCWLCMLRHSLLQSKLLKMSDSYRKTTWPRFEVTDKVVHRPSCCTSAVFSPKGNCICNRSLTKILTNVLLSRYLPLMVCGCIPMISVDCSLCCWRMWWCWEQWGPTLGAGPSSIKKGPEQTFSLSQPLREHFRTETTAHYWVGI